MTKPKKKRGFRKIVVDGIQYNWRLDNEVVILPDEISCSRLTVDFGFYDPWLYVNDKENEPEAFEPRLVTPKFIEACIRFALSVGWLKGGENQLLEIVYRKGVFERK
ncbi:MAG: hypothetical protein AAFX87_04790 [Bacteroidota bacterium]